MRYVSKIVGLPILAKDTGEQFSTVKDLIYDEEANRVIAIMTEVPSLLGSARAIAFNQILSVGEDAVVVPAVEVEVKAVDDEMIGQAIKRGTAVVGKTVMTEDGQNLGSISDVQIDEVTGQVLNYQASGGVFSDIYKGKPFIPAPMSIKVGTDVIFVPNSTAQLMEQQAGGLKGAGHTAASTAEDLKDQLWIQGQDLAGTVQDRAGDLREQASSDSVNQKVTQVKEQASGIFMHLKERVGEFKDQATQKVEDSRINGALGKPASRVVLDKSDAIILNVGDTITHEAVEKARTAGELEVLLSSVYNKQPDLTTEDMKAKEPKPLDGSAAARI